MLPGPPGTIPGDVSFPALSEYAKTMRGAKSRVPGDASVRATPGPAGDRNSNTSGRTSPSSMNQPASCCNRRGCPTGPMRGAGVWISIVRQDYRPGGARRQHAGSDCFRSSCVLHHLLEQHRNRDHAFARAGLDQGEGVQIHKLFTRLLPSLQNDFGSISPRLRSDPHRTI